MDQDELAGMALHETLALPAGKWARLVPTRAMVAAYMRDVAPEKQFSFDGEDGNNFAGGQYYITRIR